MYMCIGGIDLTSFCEFILSLISNTEKKKIFFIFSCIIYWEEIIFADYF